MGSLELGWLHEPLIEAAWDPIACQPAIEPAIRIHRRARHKAHRGGEAVQCSCLSEAANPWPAN